MENDWKPIKPTEESSYQLSFKPPKFGRKKETSIHHFSDASKSSYGQASYLCHLSVKLEESIAVYLWEKPCSTHQIHYHTKDGTCSSNFISQNVSATTEGTPTP